MADLPASTDDDSNMDYPEHERTYALFLSLTKWAAIAVIAILILLAWLTL